MPLPLRDERVRSVARVFARTFVEYRALVATFALQATVSWIVCERADHLRFEGLRDLVQTMTLATLSFGGIALATSLVRQRPDDRPLLDAYRSAWSEIRRTWMNGPWLASVVLALAIVPVSITIFSCAKRTIPVIHPFAWDARFEQFGRALHGGRHAWEWLQPIVGRPAITIFLDRFYHYGWPFLLIGSLALVIAMPRSLLRTRYLTAWVLLWFVGGTLAALAFSSAGPPFYHYVARGSDPYAPLLAYLDAVNQHTPLLSAGGRAMLWAAYEHHSNVFGYGISAMPSMHIATITLLACLAFCVSGRLGAIAAGAALLMQVSAVALGWHYAIDGYAGALLAIGLWWLTGRPASPRVSDRTPPIRRC